MKKYKKLHQIYLHYLLVNRRLSPEQYSVLTSLTESEVQVWFTPRRSKITSLVKILGSVVIYQARKGNASDCSWLQSKQYLNQSQYLWSSTLGIKLDSNVSKNICTQKIGLALLAIHNQRHAIIWALRLGISLPESILSVESSTRLDAFILQVAKNVDIELSGVK